MRIAILDCCCPNPPVLAHWPSVGDLLIEWLEPHAGAASLVRIDVWGGEPVPDPRAFDAFVVSGSEAGVYDDTPWMPGLREGLQAIRAAGKPMLGICFGHQIMADIFGGRARKADIGYAAGAARFSGAEGEFDAFVLHGDQVTEIPPGAQITHRADHCPVGGLAYDFAALSFQFHPEYARDYVDDVSRMFEDNILDKAGVEAALASTDRAKVAPGLMAREAFAFLVSGQSGRDFWERLTQRAAAE